MRTSARTPHPTALDPEDRRRLRRIAVVAVAATASLACLVGPAGPAGAVPPRPGADDPTIEDAAPVDDGPVVEDPRHHPADAEDPSVVDPDPEPTTVPSRFPLPTGPLPELEPAPVPGPPNEDLALLADAIRVEHRSIAAQLVVPGNLRPTAPVDVSVAFGFGAATTQAYGPRDLVFSHDFAELGGAARDELVTYWLVQHTPAGDVTYSLQQWIRVEPLYDVEVSPLRFELDDDCDWIGESEPELAWSRPDGTIGRAGLDMYGGDEETVLDFGGLWLEASRATDLREPSLWWYESDWDDVILILPSRSDARLLPGSTRSVVHYNVVAENDTFCTATIRYRVTISLAHPLL